MSKMGQKRTAPKTPLKKKPKSKPNRISDDVLDGLVRQVLRFSSGGFCKRCKIFVGGDMLETAHLYRRRRKTVRWDLRNVYPLCKNDVRTGKVGCHSIIDNDPIELASFMYDVLSKEDIVELQKLANMTIKQHPIDREQIRDSLKEKIKRMEE